MIRNITDINNQVFNQRRRVREEKYDQLQATLTQAINWRREDLTQTRAAQDRANALDILNCPKMQAAEQTYQSDKATRGAIALQQGEDAGLREGVKLEEGRLNDSDLQGTITNNEINTQNIDMARALELDIEFLNHPSNQLDLISTSFRQFVDNGGQHRYEDIKNNPTALAAYLRRYQYQRTRMSNAHLEGRAEVARQRPNDEYQDGRESEQFIRENILNVNGEQWTMDNWGTMRRVVERDGNRVFDDGTPVNNQTVGNPERVQKFNELFPMSEANVEEIDRLHSRNFASEGFLMPATKSFKYLDPNKVHFIEYRDQPNNRNVIMVIPHYGGNIQSAIAEFERKGGIKGRDNHFGMLESDNRFAAHLQTIFNTNEKLQEIRNTVHRAQANGLSLDAIQGDAFNFMDTLNMTKEERQQMWNLIRNPQYRTAVSRINEIGSHPAVRNHRIETNQPTNATPTGNTLAGRNTGGKTQWEQFKAENSNWLGHVPRNQRKEFADRHRIMINTILESPNLSRNDRREISTYLNFLDKNGYVKEGWTNHINRLYIQAGGDN